MRLTKVTFLLVASLLLSPLTAMAEIKTFTKEYTYEASELDSKVTSRFNALEQAKRLLLEELGIFLTSRTEVTNSQLTKDEITSLTAGIVSAVVIEEKWDGHKYWLKAKIDADPTVVQQAIEVIKNDYKKTTDLEKAQKQIAQLTKDLEAVKQDLSSNPQERQKKYTKIVNQKQSIDLVIKFYSTLNPKKSLADNKEAHDAINKAIESDPEFLVPYVMRATLYGEIAKDYQKAINDMSTAIKVFAPSPNNPYENTAMLYEARGKYYWQSNKLTQAMSDFMTALEVAPDQILRSHSEYAGLDINVFVKKMPKDYRSYVLRARYNSYFESRSTPKAYDNAIADLKKALKLNDKNPVTYYVLTEALVFKAMWNDASLYEKVDTVSHSAIVDAATKALRLLPSKEWKLRFLKRRAQEHLLLKQYKQAISDYTSRIQLDPDDAGAYHDRAIAFSELGEFSKAISDLTKAIGMKNNAADWPRTGYEIRASVYEKMSKFKEAADDYTNAFDTWKKVFGKFNKEEKLGSSVAFDILQKRGAARRQIQDYAGAIEDYRLAISWMEEFHPHMIYGEIADTFMEMKKPTEALVEYDKAIAKNKKQHGGKRDKEDVLGSAYHAKKATAYQELGQVNNAFDSYKQALEAIDNFPPYKEKIYRNMGMLYHELEIYPEALKCYRLSVENAEFFGPAEFLSYDLLGNLEMDLKNRNEAIRVFDKMIKFFPKSSLAYSERGRTHSRFNSYREAIADFNKAVDIDPTNSVAYLHRGAAYIMLNQREKGIRDIRISSKLGNEEAQKALKSFNLAEK